MITLDTWRTEKRLLYANCADPDRDYSIQDILGADLDRITVERAVVGLFFTGVKLDTGVTGACATPLRSIPAA